MTDYESGLQETGAIKGKEFIEFDPEDLDCLLDLCDMCSFVNGDGSCQVSHAESFCYFQEKPTVFGIWVEEKK